MISSADEFVRLRCSEFHEEYRRASTDLAPEAVWRQIIDAYPEMRVWVARNKTVPEDILRLLSEDADPLVRHAVAMKRSAPPEVLGVLASDKEEGVRLAVVMNRKTSESLLRTLSTDASPRVSEEARRRLQPRAM